MRAMHNGLHRAFATSPHDIQATIKCVYHPSSSVFCAVLSWGSLQETACVVETPCVLGRGDVQQLVFDGGTSVLRGLLGYGRATSSAWLYWLETPDSMCMCVCIHPAMGGLRPVQTVFVKPQVQLTPCPLHLSYRLVLAHEELRGMPCARATRRWSPVVPGGSAHCGENPTRNGAS
jgi:hypothetical protein